MPARPLSLLPRRLRADRRGATAVETGFVMVPMTLIIVGIVEIGWQFTTASMLDAAALRGSRFGATGRQITDQQGNTVCRSSHIPAMVSQSTNGFLRTARVQVTSTAYSAVSVTLAAQTDNNITGTSGYGGGGQIVRYDLAYNQPFLTGAWTTMFGGPGSITHRAAIVVKNEPFQNATC